MKKNKAIYYQSSFLAAICFLLLMSCGGQSNQYTDKQGGDNVLEKTTIHHKAIEKDRKFRDTIKPDKAEIPVSNISKKKEIDTVAQSNNKKKPKSPYLSGRNTSENFIKNYRMGKMEFPIHLTGRFAWSSEKNGRKFYEKPYRPIVGVKELYPGILHYRKWVPINPKSDKVTAENDKVEYYDEKGKLLKTFDVDKENPYLKKYPDLVHNFYNSEGRIVDENALPERKKIKFRSDGSSVHIDKNTGFTVISYTLNNYNEIENLINFKITIIVIDTLGNEINRLADKELSFMDTYVTPKGGFLAICTGGMVNINNFGDDMRGHRNMGVRIYDLKDMSLIYKKEGIYSDGVFKALDKPEWIYFMLTDDNNLDGGNSYFIDPINKVEYMKFYKNSEWNLLSKKFIEWKGKNCVNKAIKFFNYKKRYF